MKLTRVKIIRAATCGGMLDGLDIVLRSDADQVEPFAPLCLVGPNGAGKSQFLQVVAESFQAAFHACDPTEERSEANEDLQFEIEYVIRRDGQTPLALRISRQTDGRRNASVAIEECVGGEWISCALSDASTRKLLPSKIIGYTSGDNETLSLPFLISRAGYAKDVTERALKEDRSGLIPDTRLMLVDYGTHLEVLVANLLVGLRAEQAYLLKDARLEDLHSFRCIVQLAHSVVPKRTKRNPQQRKGIQLTEELEKYLDQVRRCSTCHSYDEKSETYVFDFLVTDDTRKAFQYFWRSTIELYSAFHKLSMLNDLAIPRAARLRLQRDLKARRFAARLPEPQDEHRVFRFEQVRFRSDHKEGVVDYVSLSDGEHQLVQVLGTMCMASDPNVLFLLDEPESHFNPQWRVKFVSRLVDLPTTHGPRSDAASQSSEQDLLLTTHSPFVPSDMPRENVLIFVKGDSGVSVRRPEIETFGATFDSILEECFDVSPPMSEIPRLEIESMMTSDSVEEIPGLVGRLGDSVERAFLIDRIRQLTPER